MPDIVVCGAGVVGLTTALRLQERGANVSIIARELPTKTTSAVAAAIWYPYLAEPQDAVLRWSAKTYQRLGKLAEQADTGVRMQRVFERQGPDETPTPWWASAADGVEQVQPAELPKGVAAGIRSTVPVCDTRQYLPWLLSEFRRANGKVIERELTSLEQAFDLAAAVVNCTGLGAAMLCNDRKMQPIRGQIVVVESTGLTEALIDDTGPGPIYVVPRGDDCVLGGTAQPDDTTLTANDADTLHILEECRGRIPALTDAPVREVKVGLRPYRETVRLQEEPRAAGQRLVHNYGHGGSGFTLSWGCADDVADLLL